MFRYGNGQMKVGARFPTHLRGVRAFPLVAALIGLGLAFLHLPWALALFSAYLVVIFSCSLLLASRAGELRHAAGVTALFAVTHLSYAAGEIAGLKELVRRASNRSGTEGKTGSPRLSTLSRS